MNGYGPLAGEELKYLSHFTAIEDATLWRGKRPDPTGLYYMGKRYYDPIGGRFISPDPLGHEASMDLYSYANGDPVNFVDPTGRAGQQVTADSAGDPTGGRNQGWEHKGNYEQNDDGSYTATDVNGNVLELDAFEAVFSEGSDGVGVIQSVTNGVVYYDSRYDSDGDGYISSRERVAWDGDYRRQQKINERTAESRRQAYIQGFGGPLDTSRRDAAVIGLMIAPFAAAEAISLGVSLEVGGFVSENMDAIGFFLNSAFSFSPELPVTPPDHPPPIIEPADFKPVPTGPNE